MTITPIATVKILNTTYTHAYRWKTDSDLLYLGKDSLLLISEMVVYRGQDLRLTLLEKKIYT